MADFNEGPKASGPSELLTTKQARRPKRHTSRIALDRLGGDWEWGEKAHVVNEGLPTLLTVRQACRELQIGRTRLHGLCQAGALRTVRVGPRGVRIPRGEIARFIREQLGEGGG